MKHGIEIGEYERYHQNGQLAVKGAFINGKKEGRWVEYMNGGILWQEAWFKDEKKLNKGSGGGITVREIKERYGIQ